MPGPLTTAVVAFMEGEVSACKIVDQLVLPDEESAFGGNGVIDGSRKNCLRAVEGAYPATVNVQLQRSRVSEVWLHPVSAPTSSLAGRHLLRMDTGTPRAPSPCTVK